MPEPEIDPYAEAMTPPMAGRVPPPIEDDPYADYDLALVSGGGGLTPEISVNLNYDVNPEEAFNAPLAEGRSHMQNLLSSGSDMIEDFRGRRHIIPAAAPIGEQAGEFMEGIGGFIRSAPELLSAAITRPAQVGKAALAGIGSQTGKFLFGTPQEQARVMGQSVPGMLIQGAGMLGKGAAAGAREFRALRAERELAKTHGKVGAAMGVSPNLPFDFYESLSKAMPWIKSWIKSKPFREGAADITTSKGKFAEWFTRPSLGEATADWAKITDSVADEFFTRNYQYIAEPFKNVPVDTSPLAKGLRELAEGDYIKIHEPGIARRLGKVADSYEGQTKTIAEMEALRRDLNAKLRGKSGQELPKGFLNFEVNGLRDLIDSKLDELVTRNVPMSEALRIYRDLARVRDIAAARVPQVRSESLTSLGRHATFVPTFVTETGLRAQAVRSALKAVETGRNHPDNLLREVFRALERGGADFGGEPLPIVIQKFQAKLPPAGGSSISIPGEAPEILEPNILTTSNPVRNQPIDLELRGIGGLSRARNRSQIREGKKPRIRVPAVPIKED